MHFHLSNQPSPHFRMSWTCQCHFWEYCTFRCQFYFILCSSLSLPSGENVVSKRVGEKLKMHFHLSNQPSPHFRMSFGFQCHLFLSNIALLDMKAFVKSFSFWKMNFKRVSVKLKRYFHLTNQPTSLVRISYSLTIGHLSNLFKSQTFRSCSSYIKHIV